MSDDTMLEIAESYQGKAYVDNAAYLKMYEESIRDPEGFGHSRRIGSTGPENGTASSTGIITRRTSAGLRGPS